MMSTILLTNPSQNKVAGISSLAPREHITWLGWRAPAAEPIERSSHSQHTAGGPHRRSSHLKGPPPRGSSLADGSAGPHLRHAAVACAPCAQCRSPCMLARSPSQVANNGQPSGCRRPPFQSLRNSLEIEQTHTPHSPLARRLGFRRNYLWELWGRLRAWRRGGWNTAMPET